MLRLLFMMIFLFSANSACLSQENSGLLCSDGIDNDGDGLIDCDDPDCISLGGNGCEQCSEGISFADVVLDYESGCPLADDPEGALGVADWDGTFGNTPEFTFLGIDGFIKLGFTDNALVNSGDNDPDIFVFEVGSAVEPSIISIRPANDFTLNQMINNGIPDPDGDGYFLFGQIAGVVASVDIDQILPGYGYADLIFDAIEIKDDSPFSCGGDRPGADIDAVCALSYDFIDCAGTLNGEALLDECGLCLLVTDSLFNQSCIDCAGVPNGNAQIDFCGECNPIDDPVFNSNCGVFDRVYIPNTFSPNNDNTNDEFRVFAPDNLLANVSEFSIYNRWGEQVFGLDEAEVDWKEISWDGRFKNETVNSGIYSYYIEIEFIGTLTKVYTGTIMVTR